MRKQNRSCSILTLGLAFVAIALSCLTGTPAMASEEAGSNALQPESQIQVLTSAMEARNVDLNANLPSMKLLGFTAYMVNGCTVSQTLSVQLYNTDKTAIPTASATFQMDPMETEPVDLRKLMPKGVKKLLAISAKFTVSNNCLHGGGLRFDDKTISWEELFISSSGGGQCVTSCRIWLAQFIDGQPIERTNLFFRTLLHYNLDPGGTHGLQGAITPYGRSGHILDPGVPLNSSSPLERDIFVEGLGLHGDEPNLGAFIVDSGEYSASVDSTFFSSDKPTASRRTKGQARCLGTCPLGVDRCGICGGDGSSCPGPSEPSCSPETQEVGIGVAASLTGSGCADNSGFFTSSGTPPSASGNSYRPSWTGPGTFAVDYKCANNPNRVDRCYVTVKDTPTSPPPVCSPEYQTAQVGQEVTFNASGGNGNYSWAAFGGNPATGQSTPFKTRWSVAGDQTAVVTSGGKSSTCRAKITNTPPAKITLEKDVYNGYGGHAVPTDWTLFANGPTPISGVHGSAAVTNAAVSPGTYTLGESGGPSGYTATGPYSCSKNGGASVSSNSITLAAGDSAYCRIKNKQDPPPSLTCSPTNQNAYVGANVQFQASGGNPPYGWTSSGTPSVGSQPTYTAQWSTVGDKTVYLRDEDNTLKKCYVHITEPPCTVTPAPSGFSGSYRRWSNNVGVKAKAQVTVTGAGHWEVRMKARKDGQTWTKDYEEKWITSCNGSYTFIPGTSEFSDGTPRTSNGYLFYGWSTGHSTTNEWWLEVYLDGQLVATYPMPLQ